MLLLRNKNKKEQKKRNKTWRDIRKEKKRKKNGGNDLDNVALVRKLGPRICLVRKDLRVAILPKSDTGTLTLHGTFSDSLLESRADKTRSEITKAILPNLISRQTEKSHLRHGTGSRFSTLNPAVKDA